jgi:ethanolamine utilization protein EutA
MPETLLSVGLDVGTTSTQLIVSRLAVENRAGSFSVPEMDITQRQVLYKGQVHFTPLRDENRVDAEALGKLVDEEYSNAGIRREDVDTGAIIITGETSRKENARAVLSQLSGYAGDFVVATAGPDLESVLAAKGAGAVALSRDRGKTVLHMDIGGGTSNLSLIRDGKIEKTGCLNVGGRLIKLDESGKIYYVSPVLRQISDLKVGDTPTMGQLEELCEILTQALEMAAGLRTVTSLLTQLSTLEAQAWTPPEEQVVVSFSGGVADCIETQGDWLQFGDLGRILGKKIRESLLCQGEYALGNETIRATVIGAGCHSTQLSGSTVYYRNLQFPLKNLRVVVVEDEIPDESAEEPSVLFLRGIPTPKYADVAALARRIVDARRLGPVLVCVEVDMAKALGQCLAGILPPDREILCIDRVRLSSESYLDVGAPVGPALPVVVKTLVLER